MAKLILKSVVFIIYFFNVVFAQPTPALIVLDNSNLTSSCKTSIASLIDNESINECLPMFTMITTIPQLLPSTQIDPKTKLSLFGQLVRQSCSLSKCSSSLVQNTALTLKETCSVDLLQQNIMATLNLLLFSHYEPIRELICIRDTSKKFEPFCILETLTNIGIYNANSNNLNKRHSASSMTTITLTQAANPTTPPTSETLDSDDTSTPSSPPPSPSSPPSPPSYPPPSSSSPSQESSMLSLLKTLPNSIVCTDCNKAMVSVVLKYLKENPAALNETGIQPAMIQQGSQGLELKCGSSFLDASIPKTISGTSRLTHSYYYIFIGILFISTYFI